MPKDKYQVSLKALLTDKDGKMLFLKASSKGSYAGYYDLPGGRIEVDELETPLLDIISREIKEELGDIEFRLDMRPAFLLRAGIGPNGETHIFYVVYRGEYLGGEIKTSDEHEGLVWEDPKTFDIEKHIKSVHREDFGNYLKTAF